MHPGELLREEILPALDRSKTEIAKLLGVSRQRGHHVIGSFSALMLASPIARA